MVIFIDHPFFRRKAGYLLKLSPYQNPNNISTLAYFNEKHK